MNRPQIGIVGCGFVGSAVVAGFSLKADIKIYDKFKVGFDSLEDVCKQDIIFLCLPTPMRKSDGMPEMSFIEDTLTSMHDIIINDLLPKNIFSADFIEARRKTIVIKSTVLPGTNRRLQRMFPLFDFVSNPEFLTARSARLDFINTSRIVLGGEDKESLDEVAALYRTVHMHTPIYFCTWEEAELVKYMANCFFAAKISYLNEMFIVCKRLGCNYETVKGMWLADGRIGNSHHEVPGHDGDYGFGGTCFPKDLAAFTAWAKTYGLPSAVLDAAKQVNQIVRQKQDWEVYDDKKGVK